MARPATSDGPHPEHRAIPVQRVLHAFSERLLTYAEPGGDAGDHLHVESRAGLFRALSEALAIQPTATHTGRRGNWWAGFSAGHPSNGPEFDTKEIDGRVAAVASAVADCVTAVDASARSAAAAASDDSANAERTRHLMDDVLRLIQRIVGESLSRLSRLTWLQHRVVDPAAREQLAAEVRLQRAQMTNSLRVLESSGISLVMYDETADATWFTQEVIPAIDGDYAVDDGATLLPAVVVGEHIIVGVYARRITVRTS